MPAAGSMFEVEFDFVDHRLIVRTSAGAERNLPLEPRSVAEFYAEYMGVLADLGIVPRFRAQPSEMVEVIPFAADRTHAAYDADAAQRCWRIVTESARVLQRVPLAIRRQVEPGALLVGRL